MNIRDPQRGERAGTRITRLSDSGASRFVFSDFCLSNTAWVSRYVIPYEHGEPRILFNRPLPSQ